MKDPNHCLQVTEYVKNCGHPGHTKKLFVGVLASVFLSSILRIMTYTQVWGPATVTWNEQFQKVVRNLGWTKSGLSPEGRVNTDRQTRGRIRAGKQGERNSSDSSNYMYHYVFYIIKPVSQNSLYHITFFVTFVQTNLPREATQNEKKFMLKIFLYLKLFMLQIFQSRAS